MDRGFATPLAPAPTLPGILRRDASHIRARRASPYAHGNTADQTWDTSPANRHNRRIDVPRRQPDTDTQVCNPTRGYARQCPDCAQKCSTDPTEQPHTHK